MKVWARNNKHKAEVLADQMADIFTPNQTNEGTRLENIASPGTQNITLTPKKRLSKKLKSKQAPGFDLITYEILKPLSQKRYSLAYIRL